MKHKKITCDRCKRDVEEVGNSHREINYRTVPPFMSSTGSETKEISLDLCEECMRIFHDTIQRLIRN